MYWPTRSRRDTSLNWPSGSTPSASQQLRRRCGPRWSCRCPGAPAKIRWWLTAPTARPASRRHSLTWISSMSARTSALTPARPIIASSSASSFSTCSGSCWVAPSTAARRPWRVPAAPSASTIVGVAPSSSWMPGAAVSSMRHSSTRPPQPRPKKMPDALRVVDPASRIVGALLVGDRDAGVAGRRDVAALDRRPAGLVDVDAAVAAAADRASCGSSGRRRAAR